MIKTILLSLIIFHTSLMLIAFAQDDTIPGIKELIISIDKERVVSCADKFMFEPPATITLFKAVRSTGSRHDFYSEGDYWWPDSANPQGPYIRKDGLSNPDNFTAHREAMRKFSIQVPTLAAAFKMTGNKKYAEHALKHILAWFVDADTRMNPHMLYAQAIKGVCTGRGIGIIDTIHLIELVQSIIVLERYGTIDPETLKKIKEWFKKYSEWLMHHQYGIDERNNGNNHSTCWAMQLASYAKLIGDTAKLNYCINYFQQVILPQQMNENGGFPKELARTKPYSYSLFNLDAMIMVVQLLSSPGNNLWTYKTSDGRNIRKAVDFMFPYIKDRDSWPYNKDVMYFNYWPVRHPSLLFAGIAFQSEEYIALWKTLNPAPDTDEVLRNFFIRQPILWIN